MTNPTAQAARRAAEKLPDDPRMAFALLVSRCANGFIAELIEQGKTEEQAKLEVIHLFLAFASGEACRMARRDGREPDRKKWRKATNDAFDRAVKRTADELDKDKVKE